MSGNNEKEYDSLKKDFWDWFFENEPTFYYGTDNEDLRDEIFKKLKKKIEKINEYLTFAISPIQEGEQRSLVISADGMKDGFEAVLDLVKAAPDHPNWKIIPFRERLNKDDLAINYGGYNVGYTDIYFRYVNEEKFGIELNIRDYEGTGKEQNAIYVLLDSLLGEYDTVTEIDWIDWIILDEKNIDDLFPLIELRDLIDQKKEDRNAK